MATFSMSGSTGKQMILSLRGLSHEVCVAATQTTYWQQLTRHSSISIVSDGKYVPIELERLCSDQDEIRLHLIVRSQSEQDNQQFDNICTQIRYDLVSFEHNDRPIYNSANHQVIVFGSLYNSLPEEIFDTERNLLGQRNINIKKIRSALTCSIEIDSSMSQRYRFTIHHEKQMIMDLAAIEIQGLVKQTQNQYMIAFANQIGRSLIGSKEPMETSLSLTDPNEFPSFKSFQPAHKRRRDDDEEHQRTTIAQTTNTDSDQSDDETISDERRSYITSSISPARSSLSDSIMISVHFSKNKRLVVYTNCAKTARGYLKEIGLWSLSDWLVRDIKRIFGLQQRREQVEHLLVRICERMQARTPRDHLAKVREDSSQIKSYFRHTNALKSTSNPESEFSIELMEHEIDLRTRGSNEHKCTLVFNKMLKMGVGARDRLKKTAKIHAYDQLKRMTRDIPREYLVIKPTRDGLWKAVEQLPNH